MSIATNLKRELIRHDVSVAVLSERTGVSKASINKYLSGDVKPALEVLSRLADGLGITADELNTKREPRMKGANVNVETAAQLMGKSPQWVRLMLQKYPDKLPIGNAVKLNGNRYTYYISPELFRQYTGIAVGGTTCPSTSTPNTNSTDSSARMV